MANCLQSPAPADNVAKGDVHFCVTAVVLDRMAKLAARLMWAIRVLPSYAAPSSTIATNRRAAALAQVSTLERQWLTTARSPSRSDRNFVHTNEGGSVAWVDTDFCGCA
jgi:hypothetical protein